MRQRAYRGYRKNRNVLTYPVPAYFLKYVKGFRVSISDGLVKMSSYQSFLWPDRANIVFFTVRPPVTFYCDC